MCSLEHVLPGACTHWSVYFLEHVLTGMCTHESMYLLERASRRLGALHIRPEASELCERLMWCRSPPAPSKRALSSWSNSTVLVGDWAALGDWLVLGEGSPELSPESRLLLAADKVEWVAWLVSEWIWTSCQWHRVTWEQRRSQTDWQKWEGESWGCVWKK